MQEAKILPNHNVWIYLKKQIEKKKTQSCSKALLLQNHKRSETTHSGGTKLKSKDFNRV